MQFNKYKICYFTGYNGCKISKAKICFSWFLREIAFTAFFDEIHVIDFLKVFLGGYMFFLGATGTPILDFWWRLLCVSNQSGFCFIHYFVEVNVMYSAWDPPLVLHMPTSWQPVLQPVTSPHASAEVEWIWTGNHLHRRQTRYHCASYPAFCAHSVIAILRVLKSIQYIV